MLTQSCVVDMKLNHFLCHFHISKMSIMDISFCKVDTFQSIPLPLPSLEFFSFGLLKMRYSRRFLELVMLDALELLCLLKPGGLAADVKGEKRET